MNDRGATDPDLSRQPCGLSPASVAHAVSDSARANRIAASFCSRRKCRCSARFRRSRAAETIFPPCGKAVSFNKGMAYPAVDFL